MSEPMKKRLTKGASSRKKKSQKLRMVYQGKCYDIPKHIAEKYQVCANDISHDSVSADDLFADLDRQFTKAGVLLQGIRYRENLSQVAFAKKLGVTQPDLSKMENGKRPIGKRLAKRIEKLYGVNYRALLE